VIVRAAPPEHFAWLYAKTGHLLAGSSTAIEAIDSAGRIRGMVGYDDWTPNSVRMHLAVDTPVAGRALLLPAFAYPFLEVGVELAIGTIVTTNRRSLALALHLGFREVYRVKDGWASGEHLALLELHRSDCRFITQIRKAA
jgi:RimJ/RimL family protein N-acetyltransferase